MKDIEDTGTLNEHKILELPKEWFKATIATSLKHKLLEFYII